VCVCVCVCLHGGGGQVGVLVLQLAVQSEAPLLAVLVERGGQSVHLAEGGAGRHLVTMETTRQSNRRPTSHQRLVG